MEEQLEQKEVNYNTWHRYQRASENQEEKAEKSATTSDYPYLAYFLPFHFNSKSHFERGHWQVKSGTSQTSL